MSKTLRVLLLEDNEADADLITGQLENAGLRPIVERVDSRDAFARALRDFKPEIVLSDHSPGQLSAPGALEMVRALRPATGLIIVSCTIDERTAVACLRGGAEDIVLKSNLGRLRQSIEAARLVRRPLERLSPRQLQVLRLVAEGHTSREIAKRLRLSIKTIETHRGEVMKRLGIHDVVGLVRYAVRVGIVGAS
jgi:DNA-binding NarL/FixJ family response regulator